MFVLLADVFENFRSICLKQYLLDPAHYLTSPFLSLDPLLKKIGPKLKLLMDVDMHLFIEIAWKTVMPTEEQILAKSKARIDSRGGSGVSGGASQSPQWISTRPGKKKIEKEWISDYQEILAEELGLKPNETKLVLTLQDKKNYVVHYRNLQFYLKLGMKLKQVHSTLEFDQECWMKPYIRMNTKLRKKATNALEKNFYKLMKNSVFGKTMENVRKRIDIKIVCNDEKKKSQTDYESVYCGVHTFLQQLRRLACSMHRENVRLDKPLYAGMTILDNSKILMYDLFLQHAEKAVQREV